MIGRALFLRRVKRLLLVGGVGFVAFSLVANLVVVEYTTQPEFCGTCHNMRPYVESWKTSTHSQVPCIDCHYEPGLLETLEGKYKALSQLAKYATQTEGTKPWAEVSDASCMRQGCHQTRFLSGRIPFGRVFFDHRHHLLETRRGKRLRCTTCHSQIVQGSHITVTASACFICHFKPGGSSWKRRLNSGKGEGDSIGDCDLCHGPPQDEIDVAGALFSHPDYVVKHNVDCRKCHDDVTRGDASVGRERCRQCHGEVEHIERFEETEFIHENHVSKHKVECFECHTEIQHSLRPRHGVTRSEHVEPGSCASCHGSTHLLQEAMNAGRVDGEEMPSRMFQTRVSCRACHMDEAAGSPASSAVGLPRATEIACFGCHGVEFEGMLASWQRVTGETLEKLETLLGQAEGMRLDTGKRDPAIGELLSAAARRLKLVRDDNSGGAHNLELTLRLLEKARDDLEQVRQLQGQSALSWIPVGPRIETNLGCTKACHIELERVAFVEFEGRKFRHAGHLLSERRREALGDCDRCHDIIPPGEPSHGRTHITKRDCAGCHHDSGGDCESCHEAPRRFLQAEVQLIDDAEPSPMEDLDCTDCHESPGEGSVYQDALESCAECHDDEDGAELVAEFKTAAGALRQDLAGLEQNLRLASVRRAEGTLEPDELEKLDRAGTLIQAVRAGGLLHNTGLTMRLLGEARSRLDEVLAP